MADEKQAKPKKTEEKEEPEKPAEKPKENIVLVGRKPVMNYVVACITFFNAGKREVVVKARGRAISSAVDTVELLRRAFVKGLEINSIEIGTEEMVRPEGQRANVSTMEITVTKAESK